MVLQQHSSTQISSGPPPIAPAPGPQQHHIATASQAMQSATPFSGAATQAMTAAHGGVMPQVQLIQQPIAAPYLHHLYNGQGQLIMPAGMLQQAMNPTQMVIATAGGKSYLQAQPQMVAGHKTMQFSSGQPGGGQGPGQAGGGYATGPGGGPGQPQTFVIGQLNSLGVISSQASLMSAQQAQQRNQELSKVFSASPSKQGPGNGSGNAGNKPLQPQPGSAQQQQQQAVAALHQQQQQQAHAHHHQLITSSMSATHGHASLLTTQAPSTVIGPSGAQIINPFQALPQGLTWATAPAGFQFSNISNQIFIRNTGPGGQMTAGTVTTNLGGAQVVTAAPQGNHGMQGHGDGQHQHQQQTAHSQHQQAAQHHQQSVIIPGHQFAQAGPQMVTGMLPSMVPGSPMGMTVSHQTLVSNQGMTSQVNHPPSSQASVVVTSTQQQIQPAPTTSKAQHQQQHTQTTSQSTGTTMVGSITPTMPIQPKGTVRPMGVQMTSQHQHIQGYPSQIRAMASITPSVGSQSPVTVVSGQNNVMISAGDHTKAGNAKQRKPAMSRASGSQTHVATKTTTTDSAAGPGPVPIRASVPQIAPSMAGSPVTSYHSPITVVGVGQHHMAQNMANMVPVSSAHGVHMACSTQGGSAVVWSPLTFTGSGQAMQQRCQPQTSSASFVSSMIRPSTTMASGTTVRLPTSVGLMSGGQVSNVATVVTSASNARPVVSHPGKLPLPPVSSYSTTMRPIRSTSVTTSTAGAMPGMGVRMPMSGTPPPMNKPHLPTAVRSGPGSAPVSVGYVPKPAGGAPLGPSSAGSLPSSSISSANDVEFVTVSRPSSVPGMTSTSHASTSTSVPSPLSNMVKNMPDGIRRTATPPVMAPVSELKAEEPVRSPAVKDAPASPAMATKPETDTTSNPAGATNDTNPQVPTSVPSVLSGPPPSNPIPNPPGDLVKEQPADVKMASPKKPVPSVQSPMKNGIPTRVLRQKQPIVKPPVLTHVIDGFVILEGPEPFGEHGGKNGVGDDIKKGIRNGEGVLESGDLKRRGVHDANDEPPKKKFDAHSETEAQRPPRLLSPTGSDTSGRKSPGCSGAGRKNPSQCEVCGKIEVKRRPGRPAARKFCSPACAKKLNSQSKKSSHEHDTMSAVAIPVAEEPMDMQEAPKLPMLPEEPPLSMDIMASSMDAVPGLASGSGLEPLPEIGLYGLPANIKNWTAEDVAEWLRAIGCGEYAKEFSEQEIDGTALMLLKAEHLMQGMNVKLGPALKVCKKIEELQASCNVAVAPAPESGPASE